MTMPQTGLPTLCYIHPTVLRDMASTHTPSRTLPKLEPDTKAQMLEDINARVTEVRRRIGLMDTKDEEVEKMVNNVK